MLKTRQVEISEDATKLQYEVCHNVGALSTSLTVDLAVTAYTYKPVAAVLTMEITQPTLETVRLKLADWCDRTAAALRYAERQEDTLLPDYGRQAFDLKALPKWLQAEFRRVVRQYQKVSYDERKTITDALVQDRHPLVLIPGAIDAARAPADRADDD